MASLGLVESLCQHSGWYAGEAGGSGAAVIAPIESADGRGILPTCPGAKIRNMDPATHALSRPTAALRPAG
ncbi:hypothetical protein GCM10020369_08860 [Cryptosporangium minutisporangium]|uniref:Uncharacterized protein n=1 Tax=Cryptosporangium minutisporangium TaxID=113569 RepID=A0ABP6SR06_9ACTN